MSLHDTAESCIVCGDTGPMVDESATLANIEAAIRAEHKRCVEFIRHYLMGWRMGKGDQRFASTLEHLAHALDVSEPK